MKHNFKKIFAFLLATLMLSSMALAVVPVGAEITETITLVPNEDNFVNGVRIRFETSGTDSYAKIENGKLVLKMKQGDLLWFPDLTIKDTTTSIVYEMIADKDDIIPYVVTGIQPDDAGEAEQAYMYAQSFGNWGQWVCARMKWWHDAAVIKYNAYGDYWYKNDYDYATTGISTLPGSAILKTGDTLTTTTTFTMGTNAIRPVTSFQESGVAEPYVHVYADKDNVNPNGAFGICARLDDMMLSLDKVTALNLEETDSYVEDFETIDSYSGPIVNMRAAGTTVEFDGSLAFIEFLFVPHENVTADTKFVVRKNGEVYAEATVGSFTADADGVCKYTTHFTEVAYTDVLTICLEKDGAVLSKSSHEIDYGAQYEEFVTNPPPIGSADLIYEKYAEDFSTAITLQPGENIVNGKKWTYIKNSTNGSAVIKDGRLYFTGSNNDMILFEDLDVDQTSYSFSYDLTYLQTPEDDIWTDWNCWFGGLHYLTDADSDGNRHGYISSVTPNDVYMLQGNFGADGVFVQDDDRSGHVTFENIPQSPTQSGELYYWGGRVGNGVPTNVRSFVGVNGYGYGGLGMSAYSALGDHRVSANLPGASNSTIHSVDRKAGTLGFVCSESEVSVIVDNLSIKIKGKNIVVDGETVQIAATGKVDVADLENGDQNLIYATVDGEVKYAGDIITATRLTQINTLQILLKTGKLVADGETGLKWTTEISKADYEKLMADTNIENVAFGTIVVPTANAKGGVDKANAAKVADIAGEATADGNKYVFSGVLPVAKDARDTSYSAVGYVQVTMKDGTVVVAYADYVARNHAYALSDLVANFTEDETNNSGANNNDSTNTDTNDGAATTTDEADGKKKLFGCGSTIVGMGGLVMVSILGCACMATGKKRKNI